MAVDWSIFLNNVLPGIIIAAAGAIGASIVANRYQRKKHKKEIIENLVHQEHELFVKFTKWNSLIHKLFAIDKIEESEIRKAMDKFDIKMSELRKDIDRINRKELLEMEFVAEPLREIREQLSEQQEIFKNLEIIRSEISLDFGLLTKRIIIRLKIKPEDLKFFTDLDSTMFDVLSRTHKAFHDGNLKEQKEDIEKEIRKIEELSVKILNLIVAKKVNLGIKKIWKLR